MLSDQEIGLYLQRINYSGSIAVDLATLTALHQAHMRHIPFENLDIHLGVAIELSHPALFNKVILDKRGGFCYELNYLFFALLSSIGFNAQLISAQVFNGKSYGPDFDHLLLLITLEGQQFIADVGFGDSFQIPLSIHSPANESAAYQIMHSDIIYTVMQRKSNQEYKPQYKFTLNTYAISDFFDMCLYQQTSPASHFTQKSVCSIATLEGRNTISNGCVIQTKHGHRTIYHINGSTEYRQLLQQHFQISLAENASIAALLHVKKESAK
ncbi:arylamine N-acetyltransferase [Iodobacter sp. CM08]|uniref:arylamine N-acetyltransferase family protein n=1 Tax=Iodobacter sp. CM08 TaxID=3085902 RepID=UPI0029820F8F|nr:arylamine N-acetyltransferase [Iodobacter sp. CM08]MDW5416354.1 arylamine N-acetyltransferase [Iodobacter sp. CM08]